MCELTPWHLLCLKPRGILGRLRVGHVRFHYHTQFMPTLYQTEDWSVHNSPQMETSDCYGFVCCLSVCLPVSLSVYLSD